MKALSQMIGAALGTQQVITSSRALTARQSSLPYDHDRMRLFGELAAAFADMCFELQEQPAVTVQAQGLVARWGMAAMSSTASSFPEATFITSS